METLKLYIMKILVRVTIYLFTILMLSSCNNGWSVGNIDIHAEDSMYTFVEVLDQDSTSHFYSDHIRFDSDNWCFVHHQWEVVRKK